jgi:hypothetical protein
MLLADLIARLDDIAWDEQLDSELRDRNPGAWATTTDETEQALAKLGAQLDSPILSDLERIAGYEVWALRLSPYVADDPTATRLLRLREHRNPAVRSWVAVLSRRRAPPPKD